MRLDHLLSSESFPPAADPQVHRHDSGVKASVVARFGVRLWSGPLQVHSVANAKQESNFKNHFVKHSRQVFLQGRQNERRVDALALRADEGRGIAAICVGEPRAGTDPTISEWGNPTSRGWLPSEWMEGTGRTETSQ